MMGAPAQPAAKAGPKIGIDDARAAWQPKPRIPVRLMDNYINFMVIGECHRCSPLAAAACCLH